MADFMRAHAFTAQWEGALSDHPADRGGITKYGVSIAFLQNLAAEQRGREVLHRMGIILPIHKDSVRKLTQEQAQSLFKWEFWHPLRLDDMPQRVASLLYDMAVNHGGRRAVKLAQRGYNACASGYGTQLVEDGVLGPKTRACLAHDADAIVRAIIDARIAFYHAIVHNDAGQQVNLRGWLNRANDLARVLEV